MGARRIIAIVGSYRPGGVTDQLVETTLSAARACGAVTETVWLTDLAMRHCGNCRACMQVPGDHRGRCVIDDDVAAVLARIDQADGVVLASPVNIGNVTAITRMFMERCAGAAYWPWGRPAPRLRRTRPTRPVVLISASAAPAWMARLFMGAAGALRQWAAMLDLRPLGFVWQGRVDRESMPIDQSVRTRALELGRQLAGST
ncbi:MAG: flavodoxin family protein [Rhodocyclaceae bacterium]|nr:flavodoxin family protein [Rhodocyclaceae bacterium]